MSDFSEETRNMIWTAVHQTRAVDVRSFVKPPLAGVPAPSGIDCLLTSPALLEEFFRRRALSRPNAGQDNEAGAAHEAYIKSLIPGELADIVWRQLFVDHPPLSEAARTVLTTLGLFGLNVGSGDLRLLRQQFEQLPKADRLERIFSIANLDLVLFPVEALADETEAGSAPPVAAMRPVLSLNLLLANWKESARRLRGLGYGVKGKVDEFAPLELRRFLISELSRVAPVAMSFDWPVGHHPRDESVGRLMREAALPLCKEKGLPFFVAAGEREIVPGAYDQAIDIVSLSPLWEDAPDIRFLLFPTREEQLFPASRAAARSRNLLLCGPDRALSYPLSLENFIRHRLETSGSGFHACHSGAETLEGLVGGWAHMRWTLGETLIKCYRELCRTGWRLDADDVEKDVRAILGGNARMFMGM